MSFGAITIASALCVAVGIYCLKIKRLKNFGRGMLVLGLMGLAYCVLSFAIYMRGV